MGIFKSSIVFGLAEPRPAKGFPDGRIRWRLRNDEAVLARVRTSDGIREFCVKEEDGFWMPAFESGGRNSNAN
jgi:hypothetical protein